MKPRTAESRDAGLVWDIKKFALHDGPGIRTTVFLKGCPLKCLWCCNPESQSFEPEIAWIRERCLGCGRCGAVCPNGAVLTESDGDRRIDPDRCDLCGRCVKECPGEALHLMGRLMSVDDVMTEVNRDAVFYYRSGGGLTLSGGEPLAQAAFAAELLRRYKQEEGGENTAIETSGLADWRVLSKVLRHADVVLLDIKHMDAKEHFRLTGAGNRIILRNARRIAESGKALIIRLPLIPGCNDGEENLNQTVWFAKSLPGVTQMDVLPYHRLGEPKYARLSRNYALAGLKTIDPGRIMKIKEMIEAHGLEVRIGG